MAEGPGGRYVPRLAATVLQAASSGDARAAVVAELEYQAAACAEIGSPLYADLLTHLAGDVRSGGVAWRVLERHAGGPPFSALALRLLAAVHRLVLAGAAPDLARHYPSAGGELGVEGAWEEFHAVLGRHEAEVREGTARPCQTNEPGRSAALVGGFHAISGETGLPLRVLEVGASAGLNLRWDHFRYVTRSAAWGPEDSPVVFEGIFEADPPLREMVEVAERRGCDPRPQDPTSDETILNLRASAWPDQRERYRALDGALAVARRVPATVDRADGVSWLEQQLADAREGVTTVVVHSIVFQYLTEADRLRIRELIEAAGERAGAAAPVAWLSMEPGGPDRAHVKLTCWPGGTTRLVAEAGYHGRPVRWLEQPGRD